MAKNIVTLVLSTSFPGLFPWRAPLTAHFTTPTSLNESDRPNMHCALASVKSPLLGRERERNTCNNAIAITCSGESIHRASRVSH